MKNIWIFNHYATKPDEPATREYDIGKELVKNGHKVTIFASSFSHYKLREKYLVAGEKWKAENCNGVRFIWVKTFPYKKNDWRRSLNMLSFAWRAFFLGRKIKEKPDIIIGTCVHPFAALSACLLAKKKKSRFFFEITDLWPRIIVEMGAMRESHPIVRVLRKTELYLFKKAERIIIIPPHIGDYIKARGVPAEKIVWIPNGADLKRYENIKKYNGGNQDNLVFLYSGIFSEYAGLDTVLKAAKILQDKGVGGIKFLLVGDGAEKPGLIKMAQDLGLKNTEFQPMVPKSEVYKILGEADVFISIIKNVVASSGVSSNKLNDYLASGRPIIFAVNVKNNPVEEAGAGFTISPQDPLALAEAAQRMAGLSPQERIKMGENAKEYAKKNIDIRVSAEKLERLL